MKIGIIGAGFTGLSAAYYLSKKGYEVTVIESYEKPGGLAIGFRDKKWDWSLESHYHHWFTSDRHVKMLAKAIGYDIIKVRPKTSTFVKTKILQLDSPLSLLKFEELSMIDRLRTGIVLAFLRFTPFWQPFEKVTAKRFLIKTMGKQTWEVLWLPLFQKKFAKYEDKVSMAWFWARIKSRTPSLMYPKGGFQMFAEAVEKNAKKNSAQFFYNQTVRSIEKRINSNSKEFIVRTQKKEFHFDRVICTLPSHIFASVTKGLPSDYLAKINKLEGIGATNLVLALKKPFFRDKTYWLNINEIDYPFLALVEHTNFMNKKYYGNEAILYIGNYLEVTNPLFQMDPDKLLSLYMPYLQKINPSFKRSFIREKYVFRAPFAQPIVPLHYSKHVLPITTPIEGLYLANMQQVYPWDRGTNYAIELGKKVSGKVLD